MIKLFYWFLVVVHLNGIKRMLQIIQFFKEAYFKERESVKCVKFRDGTEIYHLFLTTSI